MHCYPDRRVTLLYLYWEALNAIEVAPFGEHRLETSAFAERVVGHRLQFEALSYADLSASWDGMAPSWLSAHLRDLRERYSVEI